MPSMLQNHSIFTKTGLNKPIEDTRRIRKHSPLMHDELWVKSLWGNRYDLE